MPSTVGNLFFEMEAAIVRGRILSGQPRIDGRDTPPCVRSPSVPALPRTHGSALFTRGETQALVLPRSAPTAMSRSSTPWLGNTANYFMLHYNMPPYVTGECGRGDAEAPRNRSRPSGQARDARRVAEAGDFFVLDARRFEITESNGSSSMASVCGGCWR